MEILMLILKTVIMIVVPVATSLLTYYAKKYIDILITKIATGKSADALKKGADLILDSVNYVQQTYVDALKEQDNFDSTAQKEALNKAKERAIELMNTDVKSAIEENYGNVDTYITTVIESLIYKNK
jgi:hypothetical protein